MRKYFPTKLDDQIREEIIEKRIRETFAQLSTVHQPDQSTLPVARNQPVVEYLEDSKISVEYFKMKGSVFFSAIEKDELELKREIVNKELKAGIAKKQIDESVRFFNISAANQDEFILSSFIVGFPYHRWITEK